LRDLPDLERLEDAGLLDRVGADRHAHLPASVFSLPS
jgi:hypothetical protein